MKLNHFKCNKPGHFIEEYERILSRRIPYRLLEIGVQTGNSLRMWADAFGDSEIVGLDIVRPNTHMPNNVKMIEGNQSDVALLESLGNFDVIIDDGSHMTSHQQKSFEVLWPQLNAGGIYVIEDLETSYISQFMDSELTTMEFLQRKLDMIRVSNSYMFAFENEQIKRLTFVKDMAIIEKA